MSVGSAELATINGFNSTKPLVTLWGNEQSPVHWRFLSSLQPANRPVNINPDPIAYTDMDVQFVNTMNTLQTIEGTIAAVSFSASLINLIYWNFYQAAAWAYVGVQWAEGATWIMNSESGWNELTGSNGWVTLPVEVDDIFVCNTEIRDLLRDWKDGFITFAQFEAAVDALTNDPNCYESGTIMSTVPINGESDGLVNQYTAAVSLNCHTELEIEEANHQELVNHPSARNVFDGIFDHTIPCVDLFFLTP